MTKVAQQLKEQEPDYYSRATERTREVNYDLNWRLYHDIPGHDIYSKPKEREFDEQYLGKLDGHKISVYTLPNQDMK